MSLRSRLYLLLVVVCVSAQAAPLPQPPRNGRNSVQMIIGGTARVPLCIVPPRQYVDGTPIPAGTPCTIVIYRSRDEGKPGTYREEVGRAVGKVTRPDDLQAWIDVAANVPPDKPGAGVFYLASSAIVAGEESDLNNQYLTVIWSPGNFSVKEYPAAGSRPGAPPGRKPAVPVAALAYPAWVLDEPGDGYGFTVPAGVVPDIDVALQGTFTDQGGVVKGRLDLAPLLAEIRKAPEVTNVEAETNSVTGRVQGRSLSAELRVALATTGRGAGGKSMVVRLTANATISAERGADGRYVGKAPTVMRLSIPGEQPLTEQKTWDFVASPPRTQTQPRLRGGPAGQVAGLGAPGPSYPTPAGTTSAGHRETLVAALKETLAMGTGDSRFIEQTGTPDRTKDGGAWTNIPTLPRRMLDRPVLVFVGPEAVLTSERVGDGVRVRAVGNGTGEVWIASDWTWRGADGKDCIGRYMSAWIVLVGGQAQAAFKASQGKTEPLPPGQQGPLRRGTIRGRVVDEAGAPVENALVDLVYTATRGAYRGDPWWSTDKDGWFTCDLSRVAGGFGLLEGRYEVMPHRRGSDPGQARPVDALWPAGHTYVELSLELLRAPMQIAEPIRMKRLADLFDL